jgi:hypothetical protein
VEERRREDIRERKEGSRMEEAKGERQGGRGWEGRFQDSKDKRKKRKRGE